MSGFVDQAQLHAKAGNGGAGIVSFRREAHESMGGPDGGDGGSGGDVWVEADHNIGSLLSFKDHPFRRATDGTHGQGKTKHGKNGVDIVAKVPEGTLVYDREGALLADLTSSGDRWLAAEGGRGGKGNARFLSNRRRAPSFAEQGEVGQETWFNLELKLMADVALVGFPNAGKSTLISRISAAKPKIADYPFTTLVPNLGVVRLDEGGDMVVADIPGLIEGASEGRGLGHEFLRHIERARVLVVLIDLTSYEYEPEEQERILLHELGSYEPDLLERPRLVVGSKTDVAEWPYDGPTLSAVTGDGLKRLVGEAANLVRQARAEQPKPDAFVVHRPLPEAFRIERLDNGHFVVVGRQAERAVALSDLTNLEALDYAHGRLKSLGVDRALAKAGAHPGDIIHIGGLTFEYED